MVAQSLQTARHRAAGPVGGPVDGDVDVGFSIFDYNAQRAGNPDLDPAALFLATMRTTRVGQADRNLAQAVISPAEREVQTTLDVFAQALGQFQILGLDVDLHEVFPCRLEFADKPKMNKNL
jgi:hypothetical protein